MKTNRYESEQVFLDMIDRERNIYEHSTLFRQCRHDVDGYFHSLVNPYQHASGLKKENDALVCEASGTRFPISENVIDFRNRETTVGNSEWERLNRQFMNYHKSLTAYTLLNSLPIQNHVAAKSGMADIRDAIVVDVGAGTGHVHGSFFRHPESIRYFLVDPNLRLLHDQFMRIYPALTRLPLHHILAYAEQLPFRNGFADLVMSLSAIDHYKDMHAFIREARRILKDGGRMLISSHLDIPSPTAGSENKAKKWLSTSFFERLTRYLYYRQNKVGKDDHTYHFTDTSSIEKALLDEGFRILKSETFKRYFFIVAEK